MVESVPFRCLVPAESAGYIVGRSRANIYQILEETGASVAVSSSGETPASLSDKVVTITGNAQQKQEACRRVVSLLRKSQQVRESEEAVFVIIVPSSSSATIVGQQGSQVKEVGERSGAEVNVGRDCIADTSDQPVSITGTAEQVVSATVMINSIVQELMNKGRVQLSQFSMGATSHVTSGRSDIQGMGQVGPVSSLRTPARFILKQEEGGWIVGRQGISVQELQQSTGAHIEVAQQRESARLGLQLGDTVAQISGDSSAIVEGVHAVMSALDAKSTGQAVSSRLLVPADTVGFLIGKGGQTVQEVQSKSGASVEFARDSQVLGTNERALNIVGTAKTRTAAVIALLEKVDECRANQGRAGFAVRSASPARAGRSPSPGPRYLATGNGLPSRGDLRSDHSELRAGYPPSTFDTFPTASERAFLQALETPSASSSLTFVLPAALLQVLQKEGHLAAIAKRSGTRADLGNDGLLTLSGNIIATSLGALYLQEKMLEL